MTGANTEFTSIDIKEFFGESDEARDKDDSGIAILTDRQRALVDSLRAAAREKDPESVEAIDSRLSDVKKLSAAIARFPSLLERRDLVGGSRTPESLVESLIDHQYDGDAALQLPSKAVLGKSFIITKMHTFSAFARQSKNVGADESLARDFLNETVAMMFSLMAEDVYLNLIRDKSQPREYRMQWALSLLLLWEHRDDQTIAAVAPVLQTVWTARRKLAPAFGTLMGTSELLLISIQMDEQWTQFIKKKLGHDGVSQAMEEFLFGISFEQIQKLRADLKEKGLSSIGRDQVSDFLHEKVKSDAGMDYRDFYALYTVRRDNARARERMKLSGPRKTLEDHFIQFVTEQNAQKQMNDTFAK